jgi:hypothetical protein
MKLALFALSFLLISFNASAGQVFKIEVGKDYGSYSDADLKRRVWELERAVWQLQQKVFDMESGAQGGSVTWICKVEGMGEKFSAVGPSKALAENAAMEKCKQSPRTANGFHCGNASCSQ